MQFVNCFGAVNQICFDMIEDVIIVACHDTVKVYDMDDLHLVQVNAGHFDSIR